MRVKRVNNSLKSNWIRFFPSISSRSQQDHITTFNIMSANKSKSKRWLCTKINTKEQLHSFYDAVDVILCSSGTISFEFQIYVWVCGAARHVRLSFKLNGKKKPHNLHGIAAATKGTQANLVVACDLSL